MKKNNIFYPVVITSLFLMAILFSCKSGAEKGDGKKNSSLFKSKNEAICIWNGTPLREEPKRKSKWVSGINLGEKITYLGESQVDSNYKNREYYKVELSDGTQGWAGSFGIVIDGSSAAIKKETPLYKRPDMLTASDKELEPATFIVITEEKDKWLEVTGNQRQFKGWIKSDVITNNEEDVAIAVLIAKEFPKGIESAEVKKLEAFIDELPYKNSSFINILNEELEDIKNDEDDEDEDEMNDDIESDTVDNN